MSTFDRLKAAALSALEAHRGAIEDGSDLVALTLRLEPYRGSVRAIVSPDFSKHYFDPDEEPGE